MLEQNKAIVARWFEEYWNKGNVGIVDELASNDLLFYYPLTGELKGREPVKKNIIDLRNAFPDIHFSVIGSLIAEGDKVVGRWKGEGTQTAALGNIPATGKKVSFTGMTVYRVADSKIAEEIGEEDLLLVLRQLGVVPS